jgi:hypothetical protein
MPSTNRFKINADIPFEIKQYLVEYSIAKNISLSSFLSSSLIEYLNQKGKTPLSADVLNQYDSLDGIQRNNLTFWTPLELKDSFEKLCFENIRNAKQQGKHFIYSLYHQLNENTGHE